MTLTPDPGQQQRAIDALRCATTILDVPMQPPADMTPGEQIGYLLGAVCALYDSFAAQPRLYADGDLFSNSAPRGYADAAARLNAGNTRAGIGIRLTQYAAVLHPPGLEDAADPATAAAVAALNFTVKMLALELFPERQERSGHLLEAFGDLSLAARYHTASLAEADGGQTPDVGGPGVSPW